jgi:hypothetical protein
MILTNFITYKCNTCLRTKDIEQDNLRAFINKCTITNHCLGKLIPFKIKKTRNVLDNSVDSSVTDWSKATYPKNPNTEALSYLNTGNGTITLAVKNSMEHVINLAFSINKDVTTSFQEYTYNLSNFSIILGRDTSPAKKILRFSPTDTVLVYINGELYSDQIGTNKSYSLSADGSSVILGQKIFTPSDIKIIVYQAADITYSEFINFYANFSENHSSAWNNITKVSIAGEDYRVFTCSNFENLPINTRLNLLPGITDLNLNDCFLLLANPNYTAVDRILGYALSLANINDESNYIKIGLQNREYVVQCTSSSLEPVSLIHADFTTVKNSLLETTEDISTVSSTLINGEIESNVLGVL